jgi:hypothetical protein
MKTIKKCHFGPHRSENRRTDRRIAARDGRSSAQVAGWPHRSENARTGRKTSRTNRKTPALKERCLAQIDGTVVGTEKQSPEPGPMRWRGLIEQSFLPTSLASRVKV